MMVQRLLAQRNYGRAPQRWAKEERKALARALARTSGVVIKAKEHKAKEKEARVGAKAEEAKEEIGARVPSNGAQRQIGRTHGAAKRAAVRRIVRKSGKEEVARSGEVEILGVPLQRRIGVARTTLGVARRSVEAGEEVEATIGGKQLLHGKRRMRKHGLHLRRILGQGKRVAVVAPDKTRETLTIGNQKDAAKAKARAKVKARAKAAVRGTPAEEVPLLGWVIAVEMVAEVVVR